MPGIAPGAAGYGFATKSNDRAGQVLGVVVVALCVVSVAIPLCYLPKCFLSGAAQYRQPHNSYSENLDSKHTSPKEERAMTSVVRADGTIITIPAPKEDN